MGTNRAPCNSPRSTPLSNLYCYIKKLLRGSNHVKKLSCRLVTQFFFQTNMPQFPLLRINLEGFADECAWSKYNCHSLFYQLLSYHGHFNTESKPENLLHIRSCIGHFYIHLGWLYVKWKCVLILQPVPYDTWEHGTLVSIIT